jgi:hypothetical protein
LRAAPATMHQPPSTSRRHPCMSSRHATGPEAHLFGMAIAAFGLGRAFKSATELQRASQRQELRTPRAVAAAHAERCTVTPIIPSITIEHFVIGITAAEAECWHAAPLDQVLIFGEAHMRRVLASYGPTTMRFARNWAVQRTGLRSIQRRAAGAAGRGAGSPLRDRPVVTVRENFVACDVLSQLQRVMDNPRLLLTGECEPLTAGSWVRIYASRGPYVCIYHKTRSRPANGHTRKFCRNNLRPRLTPQCAGLRPGSPSRMERRKLIPFLGAAHKGRKLGVEARGSFEER